MDSSLFNRSLGRSASQKVSACQCNENADKLIEKLGEVNWGVKENWYPVMYKEKKKLLSNFLFDAFIFGFV